MHGRAGTQSGQLLRLWQDELPARPPFRVDDQALFVAYYASAEVGCFLSLGWPVPARLLDLFAEFRNETNGLALTGGSSLLGALAYHHIPSITSDQKHEDRELVMRGGPWSGSERRRILDYCQTDVDAAGAATGADAPAHPGPRNPTVRRSALARH